MIPNSSLKNRNNLRAVFIFRLSAIGDVIIAARTVTYFVKNNYDPIFVSSIHLKNILLKIKDLKHFVCFDDEYKSICFLNGREVGAEDFREYLKENINENHNQVEATPLFCDLQGTARSRRALRILRDVLFHNQKIIVNKVKKNSLKRFWMILLAYSRSTQKKRKSSFDNFTRVHELQLNTVNKIFANDNKPAMQLTQDIYLTSGINLATKKYVCLFPGASGALKIWPLQHFADLMRLILEKTTYEIYICGGKQDVPFGEYLSSRSSSKEFSQHERVHNVVGKHSLAESMDLISHASHVFCNDSFAAHVADAYQVPATVIFGATTPKFGFVPLSPKIKIRYLNLGCSPCSRHGKGKCRYGNLKCLTQIEPHEIFKDFIRDTQ